MKTFLKLALPCLAVTACLPTPEVTADDGDLARYAAASAEIGCVNFDGVTRADIRKKTGWKDSKLDKVEAEALAQFQAIEQPGGAIRSVVGRCAV